MKDLELFRCCDAMTPLQQLHSRRYWATQTVVAWLAGGVAMAEGMVSLLVFGHSVSCMLEVAIASAVTLLLSVPAIVLLPAIAEYERELRQRHALDPGYVSVQVRLPGYVLRMIACFSAAIIAANCIT